MRLRYRAEFYDGRTEDITVSPMAIIGWEQMSGKTMGSMGSEGGVTMRDMVWLAWEQVRLRGGTSQEFEPWASELADIDVVEESPYVWRRGSLMRTLVEVSAATGVSFQSLAACDFDTIATYVDVLTKPDKGHR